MLQDSGWSPSGCRLQWFDLIAGEPKRKRPLDELDGNYKVRVIIFRDENSFDAIQASSSNPDAAPDIDKGMQRERRTTGKQGLYRFDLAIGNRDTGATGADKLRYSARPQNRHPGVEFLPDPHKYVVRKYGCVNHASPVAPLVLLGKQRKKNLDPLELKPFGDSFFIPWPSLKGEPGWSCCRHGCLTCLLSCHGLQVAHSSARPSHIAG